jgi:hypothetical protein
MDGPGNLPVLYHPLTDGRIERYHRTIKEGLSLLLCKVQSELEKNRAISGPVFQKSSGKAGQVDPVSWVGGPPGFTLCHGRIL